MNGNHVMSTRRIPSNTPLHNRDAIERIQKLNINF